MDLQVTGIFTRAPPRVQNQFFVGKLMLVDSPPSIWGRILLWYWGHNIRNAIILIYLIDIIRVTDL